MDEARKLMAEIDDAQRKVDALRKSRRNMCRAYDDAIRRGMSIVDALWSQWRAANTDTGQLPGRAG